MASAELSKKRKRADDDAVTAKKSKSDKKDKKEKKEKKAKAASSAAEDETAPAPAATDEFIALEESKKDKKERKRKEKEARKAAAAAAEEKEEAAAADVSAMDVDPPADGEKKKKKDKKSKKAKTEEKEVEAEAEEEAAVVPAEEEKKKSKKEKKDKKKEAEAKPETNGEEKSKKKDKKSKKTKEEQAAPAPAPAAAAEEEEPAEGGKREKYIVFVGNLPYTANKESIQAHFAAYKPTAVRCLNKDNNPNVCRGIAFLEFSNGSNMRTCLDKMHHTEFDDGLSPARRINLELSAGGGGKSKFRREKIQTRNAQLDENRIKRMQKEEEYKKQRASEGGTNTQQDSIHPSRLALMHQ